ncbi:hypothetical protein FNV43_RR13575 [Rhamnella rubrinervis]|uniref:ELMO domain-containing protein n=1 Tax=Rhamnella rubrinervis TaxID=2594499 RepID=A0A8K0MFE0_9ROSA|nr:hypothetical protein FNV43_RR13575 [Rhamnella rubrinervis]
MTLLSSSFLFLLFLSFCRVLYRFWDPPLSPSGLHPYHIIAKKTIPSSACLLRCHSRSMLMIWSLFEVSICLNMRVLLFACNFYWVQFLLLAFLPTVDEDEIYWRQKKGDEELEWSHDSTHVISQLAQCFTNAMVGPRTWIGGLFNRYGYGNKRNDKYPDCPLSPLQEQRFQRLQERLQVPFDETRPDHQEALRALWNAAYPDVVLKGLISEQWKEMGWQGPNPSTDFRGCGFISLENLLFYARTYPASFRRLLLKQEGNRATWEYPFAVAGINVSFMLIRMLELYTAAKPKCIAGINFVRLLGEDEEAFDVLYCIAFELMDAQWLAMQASYMEFNEVLQVTRTQLERELALEDLHRIRDLPAYNLLYQ